MSQVPRRIRVRQLADSVWPGRNVNGYANLIATRLRKLADERATGVLPVSGRGGGDGAIFFFGGQVVYAESSRVPMAVPRPVGLAALGLVPADDPSATDRAEMPGLPQTPNPPAGPSTSTGALMVRRSVSSVSGALDRLEPVIDAVTELLSAESRYARFRHAEEPPAIRVRPVPVDTLLGEVQRRHALLRQLAPGVTPDTVVARAGSLATESAQVTPPQWSLVVRAGEGITPRAIALQLGRSVFGTTIESYRLLQLGLLVAPGHPGTPAAGTAAPMSYIRAVCGERGSDA
jgi:Domain of unknown function (DUF4388)